MQGAYDAAEMGSKAVVQTSINVLHTEILILRTQQWNREQLIPYGTKKEMRSILYYRVAKVIPCVYTNKFDKTEYTGVKHLHLKRIDLTLENFNIFRKLSLTIKHNKIKNLPTVQVSQLYQCFSYLVQLF